jgi:GTP-binding protein
MNFVNQELAAYDVDLSKRPQVVALTKIEGLDKKDIDSKIKQLKKLVKRGTPVLAFSSNSGQGTKELLRTVLKQADKATKAAKKDDKESGLPVIKLRPQDEAWHVQKTDKGFVVTGRKIERFANRTNFGDYHAEQRLYDIMRKMGIVRELERQGVEAEQPIIIGSPEIGRINY